MAWKRHTRRYEGGGQFPIDMLRYDGCYPASEQDSGLIQQDRGHRIVTVAQVTHGHDLPQWTDARWASFGWTVVADDRP